MHDPDVLVFDIRSPRRDQHGYRSPLVNVWHHEPGGHDSGDVCPHYRRWQEPDGAWKGEPVRAWKWHVHHWRVQVIPILRLRTLLVDRCSWCNGRHTKAAPCIISVGWVSSRPHWWASARGIYHDACHSAWSARQCCSCEHPVSAGRWDRCARCNLPRGDRSDLQRECDRILIERVPAGTPPTREVMSLVRDLLALGRAAKTAEGEA